MAILNETFTSTGSKLYFHQEAMGKLRNKQGAPIVAHILCTDVCNYRCAFCSVQYREGDALTMAQINCYLDQLCELGLKAVILSGGGNPILYKCPDTKVDFNGLVASIHARGLEIGLISNGMKMKEYPCGRRSWMTVAPETLDKLTWLRISLAGWDHPEQDCFTPDIDPTKTTLGGSYVLHDIYDEPLDKKHGRVSTLDDIQTPLVENDARIKRGMDRVPWLEGKMAEWSERYRPQYVRLLPNCLEPSLIPERSAVLQELANRINPQVFFVQSKPPRQPHACYKIAVHPVLNCDGFVYSCDSVVLNKTAGHKFGSAWRVCKLEDIGAYLRAPLKPSVPNDICPGCVFSDQVDLIADIVENAAETPAPHSSPPQHVNFV